MNSATVSGPCVRMRRASSSSSVVIRLLTSASVTIEHGGFARSRQRPGEATYVEANLPDRRARSADTLDRTATLIYFRIVLVSFGHKESAVAEDKKLTTAAGTPVVDNQNVVTAGRRGPMLLQDVWFLEKLAHFDREVIPERRMHAKGS